jgi:F-type H+-transporting ATPase subunit delta
MSEALKSETMINSSAASLYARALLEASQSDSDLERVERELSAFVALTASHQNLAMSFVNPGIPLSRKRALMMALLPWLGEILPVTRRLLVLLANRDRLSILGEIANVYRDRLMDLRGVVRARVTTASELSSERLAVIAAALQSATGKQVKLETKVDAALLGGMMTQIGSTVYDGSIAGHLDRLRSCFLSEA